jgi:YHS domain-containing protein
MMLAALLLAASLQPEECLVRPGQRAVASATFEGKTYEFAKVECREEFLSDPERYAQLYDALAELMAAGEVPPPREASLVPS